MKRLLIAASCAVTLLLAGCASNPLAPITNPVSSTNLYQAKLVFASSQDLVIKYQKDCFGSQTPPYAVTYAQIKADPVLNVECSRRVSRYNAMKSAENKANAAIVAADNFIRNNPTGNAVTYIQAALAAVNKYRAASGG